MKTTTTPLSKTRNIVSWYEPSLRLWAAYLQDSATYDQLAEAEYAPSQLQAVANVAATAHLFSEAQ